mgnify:CR=1 FL=1
MRTILNKDIKELAFYAASAILSEIESVLEKKGTCNVGLVGGTSVGETYNQLKISGEDILEYVNFFILDERITPLDSDESNYKLISQYLNAISINVESKNLKEELINYSEKIKKVGGLDIAILSAGEDCHVAAIYPKKKYSNDFYEILKDSPKPPKERITITPNALSETKSVFLFFIGDNKKDAYKKFLSNKKINSYDAIKKIKKITIITNLRMCNE